MTNPLDNGNLPCGTSQHDIDGKPDPLANLTYDELWALLTTDQIRAIDKGFWYSNFDAIIDLTDDVPPNRYRREDRLPDYASIGEAFSKLWIEYRNIQLRALRQLGEIKR